MEKEPRDRSFTFGGEIHKMCMTTRSGARYRHVSREMVEEGGAGVGMLHALMEDRRLREEELRKYAVS